MQYGTRIMWHFPHERLTPLAASTATLPSAFSLYRGNFFSMSSFTCVWGLLRTAATAEGKRRMVYSALGFANTRCAYKIPSSQTNIFGGIALLMRRIHLTFLAVLNQSCLFYTLKKQFIVCLFCFFNESWILIDENIDRPPASPKRFRPFRLIYLCLMRWVGMFPYCFKYLDSHHRNSCHNKSWYLVKISRSPVH